MSVRPAFSPGRSAASGYVGTGVDDPLIYQKGLKMSYAAVRIPCQTAIGFH